MNLFPHQAAATARIVQHYRAGGRGFLLADAMGVGKTYTALAVAARSRQGFTVLCPAGLVPMWQSECAAWGLHPAGVYSYEYFRRYAGKLPLAGFIIADEAHKLKNAHTQVARAFRRCTETRRVLLMTGTPFQNAPDELAHLVHLVGGDGRHVMLYGRKLDTPYGVRWRWRARVLNMLGEWLSAQPWYLRRRLEDVASGMPPVLRRQVVFPESGHWRVCAEKIAHELRQAAEIAPPKAAEALLALANGLVPESIKDQEAVLQHLSSARRLLALAKAPLVADYALGLLEEGHEQVVVFMHHSEAITEVLRSVAAYAPSAAITGSVTHPERERITEAFRAGSVRVLVCSLRAAGEGLNLNTAHVAVFGEMDWNPAVNRQAEARIRRVTDTLPKQVHYLHAPHILDTIVRSVAAAKQRAMEAVLNHVTT